MIKLTRDTEPTEMQSYQVEYRRAVNPRFCLSPRPSQVRAMAGLATMVLSVKALRAAQSA